MDLEMLQTRAAIMRETRAFFEKRGYLELDTPLMAPDLIPESCLEVFKTDYYPPGTTRETMAAAAEPRWLAPSPEIWIKRLLARYPVNMFEICHCFRNGESRGFQHNPEFTMLEYYSVEADYLDSLALTEEFLAHLAERFPQARPLLPIERLTMAEAFERWAGFDLYEAAAKADLSAPGGLEAEARRLGLDPMPGLGVAALYDLIFIQAVEPNLPKDRSVALLDYPAFVPCLAKDKTAPSGEDGAKTKERWELYTGGVELANCYSEETEAAAIGRFFAAEAAEKEAAALVPHKTDSGFLSGGLPRSSGVAMGLDRLIMALTGRKTIDAVLPFVY
jgi:lysyl-tRNA synthetase class 2